MDIPYKAIEVTGFIRKLSLDELPQLFNILKGDMSIVGPRPRMVEECVFLDDTQQDRFAVRPGITGWAQVNGRNAITFDKVVMLVNGKKSKVGRPYVASATVDGTVVKNDKAKKVIVYKQRPKKGTRVKQGHRQQFTRVMINKINTKAKSAKSEETTGEE